MRTDRPETAGGGIRGGSGRVTSRTKLYHGTSAPLKKGDIVKPRLTNKAVNASATPDKAMAKNYAKTRLVTQSQKDAGYKPKVLQVKPIGQAKPGRIKGEVLSEKGFKVVKVKRANASLKTPKVPVKKKSK